MDGNFILSKLEPFTGQTSVLTRDQSTKDIINAILTTHRHYESEYEKIYPYFVTDDLNEVCKKVWVFLKKNVPYFIESENSQYVKSPAAILVTKSDCKSYALFACGVMNAMQKNLQLDFTVNYRFASYSIFNHDFQHVFCVIKTDDQEYWIDPVLDQYNERKEPVKWMDKKVTEIYRPARVGALIAMSGIGDGSNAQTIETAAADTASGNYVGAGLAVVSASLAALTAPNSDETDPMNWYNKTLPMAPDNRMLTYLTYINSLSADSGNGDTKAGRYNQYDGFYGNVNNTYHGMKHTDDTPFLSYPVALAWNNQIDADTARDPAGFSGNNNIQKFKKDLSKVIQPAGGNSSAGGSVTQAGGSSASSTGLFGLTNTELLIGAGIVGTILFFVFKKKKK